MEIQFSEVIECIKRKYADAFFRKLNTKNLSESIINDIDNKLSDILYSLLIKTLTIEINRMREHKVFCSNNPFEQYKEFNEIYSDCYKIDLLLKKYRSLETNISVVVDQFSRTINDFLSRYDKDVRILREYFGISGEISRLKFIGDVHGGSQNMIIEFSNKIIVYKTHSLGTDIFFGAVLQLLRKKQATTFSIPKSIDREEYGWQEFIDVTLEGDNDNHKIYEAMGTLLGVAYVYGISDLHKENICLSRDKVYLIDSETSFQYDFFNVGKKKSATEVISDNLKKSIMSTLLLPVNMENSNNWDISGITGGERIVQRQEILNKNTSNISIRYRKYKDTGSYNKKPNIDPREYIQDILKGFEISTSILRDSKHELFKLLSKYERELKPRVIFRNTSSYGQILNILKNSYYLKEENKNRLFDEIKIESSKDEKLQKIVNTELNDLKNMSIPYFSISLDSNEVIDAHNNVVYRLKKIKYITEIKNTLGKRLSIQKLTEQKKYIRIALANYVKNWDLGENINVNFCRNTIDKKKIINLAQSLMDQIIKAGIENADNSMVNWIDITINSNKLWIVKPMDYSLYSGLPGMILTLAYMYELTNETKYENAYLKSLRELEYMCSNLVEDIKSVSAYNGIGGIIYMYFNLYKITNDTKFYRKYKYWLEKCIGEIDELTRLDFIDGAAGLLVLFSNLTSEGENLKDVVVRLQKIILSNRKLSTDGRITWESDLIEKMHLNGFSHGISGILYALVISNKVNPIDSIDDIVRENVNIENESLVDGNWEDLRNRKNRIAKGYPDPVHWCHGAAGIGLARIFINKYTSVDCGRDIEIAQNTVIEKGFGGSDALCHGNFGNLELFFYSDECGDNTLNAIVNTLIQSKNDLSDFVCGIPQTEGKVYGLMTGISGIVYQLLRLIDFHKVPSILTMEVRKQ